MAAVAAAANMPVPQCTPSPGTASEPESQASHRDRDGHGPSPNDSESAARRSEQSLRASEAPSPTEGGLSLAVRVNRPGSRRCHGPGPAPVTARVTETVPAASVHWQPSTASDAGH
jgi:hypothetical protein